ncbi:MAG: SUMF1/EgtB/PvdO family nonheme iron enzyme, partial [Chloroflexi bacterium]|nr:SUMF1/EgtB/PvdO family nonheme iron enzyme [Chloroflexota bacterium]
MPHLITPRLIPDLALEETKKDGLGFDAYAKTFSRLIASRDTQTPMVIGIHGKWGSGKTTLLKLIKTYIDQLQTPDDLSKAKFLNDDEDKTGLRCCRAVWFNAWQYSDEDELLVALMRVVVQTMVQDEFIVKSLGKILDPFRARRDVINTVFSWFAIKAPFFEIKLNTGAAVETPFSKKIAFLDQFSAAFDRLLAAWAHHSLTAKKVDATQGVIVVFIDDLDRCLPDKTVQVLEAIKLFLDRAGVVFVLAADVDTIRSAVEAHYDKAKIKDQRADDYLEKIFQVRFYLPPLARVHIQDYLTSLAMADLEIQSRLELINAISENNPRQVKTFLNDAAIGWAILQNSGQAEGLEENDFLLWLALARVNDRFTGAVRNMAQAERMKYLTDAIAWTNNLTDVNLAAQFKRWETDTRLQAVLRAIHFSPRVNPESLEKMIFWSDIEELTQRREEERKRREEEAKRKAEEEERRRKEAEAKRIAAEEERRRKEEEEERQRKEVEARASGVFFDLKNYWIEIPAGKFVMGTREEDIPDLMKKLGGSEEYYKSEVPQHIVEIPSAYYIARYPVTNGEFARFVRESGYKSDAANLERPDHPVVNVSWRDAMAYCEWLYTIDLAGFQNPRGLKVRLPTEAEWEKAARGEDGRIYPWGNDFDSSKCNSSVSGIGGTTPVGKYLLQGDSPYGVADMSGNVWEW